jgi:hypothetical protein
VLQWTNCALDGSHGRIRFAGHVVALACSLRSAWCSHGSPSATKFLWKLLLKENDERLRNARLIGVLLK